MASNINNYTNFLTSGNMIEHVFEQEEVVCKYCGKPYLPHEVNILGKTRTVYAVDCDCIDRIELEKKAKQRKEKMRAKYTKANIGKRYIDITLKSLKEMGTEYAEEAVDFCKNFNTNDGHSVHMIGDFGNGKTSVGYGILKELLEQGFNGIYLSWVDVANRYYNSKSFNTEETPEQILNDLSNFDIVVLDEFVMNLKDEKEINFATELFDRWYKDNKSFVLINNPCDIVEMKKVPRLGKLLDRVREQADLWKFKHGSYRREKKGDQNV